MPVSSVDFLLIAQELMGRDREINHRTAANRAYYAAFHFCRDVADSFLPVAVRGPRSHERLINRLKNYRVQSVSRGNDIRVRTLGNLLAKAKPLRVHADYRIGEEFGRAKAEELILRAEKIRDVTNELTGTLSADN